MIKSIRIKSLMAAAGFVFAASPALALEALPDADMADVAARDGVRILMDLPNDTFNLIMVDEDGFTGFTDPGALRLNNVLFDDGAGATIDIDAAGPNASPTLRVDVSYGAVSLDLGTLSVHGGTVGSFALGPGSTVASLGSISMNSMGLTLDLGSEKQGDLLSLSSDLGTGGVTWNGFALYDLSLGTSYGIFTDLRMTPSGGGNFIADVDGNVIATGLQLEVNQLGSATGMNLDLVDLTLGQTGVTPSIGNFRVEGLNLAGAQLTIAGK